MIVAGFGFRGAVSRAALEDALAQVCSEAQLTTKPDVLAAPDDKAVAPVFADLAETLGAKVVAVPAEDLQVMETATQSAVSQTFRGTGSVAEACALAAAGPNGVLITSRKISSDRMATCALARSHEI